MQATYSSLIPAVLITFCQRAVSSATKAAISAVLLPTGVRPWSRKRFCTCGVFSASTTAALILCAIASGVPGGATSANYAMATNPGRPASLTVGTSGTTGLRAVSATPRNFTLPACWNRRPA